MVEHSVEERNLRHLRILVRLQELELYNHRNVHDPEKEAQHWHPRRGEGMPSPSLRDPSPRSQRREVPNSDTSNLVPEVPDPLLALGADPDDLDTRKRLPHSLIGTSVPVIGLVLDVVIELDPLSSVHGPAGRSHLMSAQRG